MVVVGSATGVDTATTSCDTNSGNIAICGITVKSTQFNTFDSCFRATQWNTQKGNVKWGASSRWSVAKRIPLYNSSISGLTFLIQAVGKDLNRYSTYIKVGVEDYIIGNVSKKVDKKLYQVEDQARFSEALIGRLRLVGSDWSFLVGSDKVSHLSKRYKIVSSIYCIRLAD